MTDVPDLPNFSHFHDAFRKDAGERTNEGDIRGGFYAAYDAAGCEYIRLADPEIDRRLKNGPDLVSANFVIPYPPGFPIMVPGPGDHAGNDRLHAQARCEGDPRLRRRGGPEAGARRCVGKARRRPPKRARARGSTLSRGISGVVMERVTS